MGAPLSLPAANPPSGPLPLRAVGGLGRLAPGLAAAAGERLWFRLPRTPSEQVRGRHTPPGGRPFVTRHHGLEVTGRVYGPEEAPTAHLVHGWGGWWQQLAAHVPGLLAAGYRVVAHDAPSHGASPAGRHGVRSTTVLEMADAFEAVVWQQGPADLVVAHSIGAMAAGWAAQNGTRAGAYAFLAPGVSVVPMADWIAQLTGMGSRARGRLVRRVERRVGHRFADLEVTTLFGGLLQAQSPPALLAVHDRGDSDTPAAGSLDLARAWPGSHLVLTEGLGHRRVIWHPEVLARVAEFAGAQVAHHR